MTYHHDFGLSVMMQEPGYFLYDTAVLDDKPKEIAVDVDVTHYHGNYFGIVRCDNLAVHVSYEADPETTKWFLVHIAIGSNFEYVAYGDDYDKAMFRIKIKGEGE
jgi:hypothetical protein